MRTGRRAGGELQRVQGAGIGCRERRKAGGGKVGRESVRFDGENN
jgi:hypothetical protein